MPEQRAGTVLTRSRRVRCPLCPTTLPDWAARARWEHMDFEHRDSWPYDIEWADA